MPNHHLDQLQLQLARASALTTATNIGQVHVHHIISSLETRILEHPDNQHNVATRMQAQRGCKLDPDSIRPSTSHGNLVTHVLPKKNGGLRIIHAPDHKDCANGLLHLAVLTPVAESTAGHLDHGFRPCDTTTTPVLQAIQALQGGQTYIAQLDVRDCFHFLPLQPPFTDKVPPHTLALIQAIHQAWRKLQPGTPLQGLPQGHPLSPAYCNVVLNLTLNRVRLARSALLTIIRYADDITILATNLPNLRLAIREVTAHLVSHGMNINDQKTVITQWKNGARIDYLGYEIQGTPSGTTLSPKPGSYERLRQKLVNAEDADHQREIITGWHAAYALTNKPHEDQRAIDFIKSLQSLRLQPRFLPAPNWGAISLESPPAARQSRFLDDLATMVAERKKRS